MVIHTPTEAAASFCPHIRAYDLLRTVNDAGREVLGFLDATSVATRGAAGPAP